MVDSCDDLKTRSESLFTFCGRYIRNHPESDKLSLAFAERTQAAARLRGGAVCSCVCLLGGGGDTEFCAQCFVLSMNNIYDNNVDSF